MTAWRVVEGGAIVAVRVTPRSARDEADGIVEVGDGRQALAVRVRAAPSDGAANEAVMQVVAKTLGLPRRAVSLVSGTTGRLKQLRLEGPAEAITFRLDGLAKDQRT